MPKKVDSESITLKNDNKNWLGQIVLTSDGAFMSVTDWGNFCFTWRSYGGNTLREFKEFLLSINSGYFGCKMAEGIGYIVSARAVEQKCYVFAEKILPVLQRYIKDNS